MTIQPGDLKFFLPEYPIDASYGGGRMSGNAVVPSVEGSIFPDITPDDWALGRTQHRKLFVACVADNADVLMAAKAYVLAGPANASVNVALISGVSGDDASTIASVPAPPANEYGSVPIFMGASLPPSGGIFYASPEITSETPRRFKYASALAAPKGTYVTTTLVENVSGTVSTSPYYGYVTASEVVGGYVYLTMSPAIGAQWQGVPNNHFSADRPRFSLTDETPRRVFFVGHGGLRVGTKISFILGFPVGGGASENYVGHVTASQAVTDGCLLSVTPAIDTSYPGIYHGGSSYSETVAELTAETPRRLEITTADLAPSGLRLGSRVSIAAAGTPEFTSHVTALQDMGGGLTRASFAAAVPSAISGAATFAVKPAAAATRGSRLGVASTTAAVSAGASAAAVNRLAYKGILQFHQGDVVVVIGGGNSEVKTIGFVDFRGFLEFATPLANAYPSGSTVAAVAALGDLRVSVGPSWGQQAWTKVFSDKVIGTQVTMYNRAVGTITAKSLGAIKERWALVMTSATTFRFIGETVGQIATGSTTVAFSPLNPLRNGPYLTIPASGWATGLGMGNALRLDTVGTYNDVFLERDVLAGSAPGGATTFALQIRASVDA